MGIKQRDNSVKPLTTSISMYHSVIAIWYYIGKPIDIQFLFNCIQNYVLLPILHWSA